MKRVIQRRYGFGAARVALRPAALRRRRTPSLRDGWRAARREEGTSLLRELRGALARASLPALFALLASLLLSAVLAPHEERTDVTLVPFEPAPEVVATAEPEPAPAPEPEPAVEPEPEPVAPPAKPEPKPEVVAVKPPEPPAPRPEAPRRAPAPPPRQAPQRPAPAIAPLSAPVLAERPEPPSPRPQRTAAPAVARAAPSLAFAAAPLPAEPEAASPAPRSEPRFQTARPSDVRPRIGLDAPAPEPFTVADDGHARFRPRVSATPSAPARDRPAPDLAFAAAALPAAPSESPRRESRARQPAPAAPPPRRDRGRPAAFGLPASPDPSDPVPTAAAAPAPRTARPQTQAAAPRHQEPTLRGVPLASLSACVSDRQEDALKQRVVAAAEDRSRCESAAGRFHFVETKNVNAFLMWIERAPGRRMGDRCAELVHALDCLAQARRGGR